MKKEFILCMSISLILFFSVTSVSAFSFLGISDLFENIYTKITGRVILESWCNCSDLDLSGKVGNNDLSLVLSNWGKTCNQTNNWCNGLYGVCGREIVADNNLISLISANWDKECALSAPSCINECSSSGSTLCEGELVKTCGNYDSDTCLEWSVAVSCGIDKKCINNVCTSSQSISCIKDNTDLNKDGKVDDDDLSLLNSNWAKTCNQINNFCDCADINQDGIVENKDLDLLVADWSSSGEKQPVQPPAKEETDKTQLPEEEKEIPCEQIDINQDKIIDTLDKNIVLDKWASSCNQTNNFCERADINQDGLVGGDDFSLIMKKWKMICSGAGEAKTPEFSKKDVKELCIPKWVCGKWSECKAIYGLDELHKNAIETKTIGEQLMICKDENKCTDLTEKKIRDCVMKEGVYVVKKGEAKQEKLEVYNKETNELEVSIKDRRKEKEPSLDINLNF